MSPRTFSSLVLLGTLSSLFAPIASAKMFIDVSDNHPNAQAILYVQTEGIVSGYPDGTYKPGNLINRAEFTKIIMIATYREDGIDRELNFTTPHFSDVPQNAWFYKYVLFARQENVVSGNPDGTFRPGASINFAEAAKILVNGFHMRYPSDTGNEWWEQYIAALESSNALPLSYKSASQLVTRGEMAEMIYRLKMNVMRGDNCKVTGCSGQLCVDGDEGDMFSTCEWREEYACYRTARCERQKSGQCGWTQTLELQQCLNNGNNETVSYTDYRSGVIGNGQSAVLFFYADWCPYCRTNDANLTSWYSAGLATVPTYKVDYDTETSLKSRYGVTVQDTHVLIDGEGNKIRSLSFPSEEGLKSLIQGE